MSQQPNLLTVQDLGEQGLLARLQQFCPSEVVGDDAALLSVDGTRSLVVTTDVLVNNIHFSDRTTSPADAGWRAVAANLSDLAAMGATPLGITVGLGLPGETAISWVEQLYQGMAACLQPYDTPIVGGDVCRSPVASIAITAFGQLVLPQAIRRANAKIGDAIVATGWHGASRAGLELLLHPEAGQRLSESDRAAFIHAHQRPMPRLDLIPLLQTLSPTRAIAGMDSSDGLADAVLQICRASAVGAILDRSQIPIPPALASWVSAEQALDWALYGGEDFELVLCLPPDLAQTLVKQVSGSAIVGTITAERQVMVRDRVGTHPDLVLSMVQGFQHF